MIKKLYILTVLVILLIMSGCKHPKPAEEESVSDKQTTVTDMENSEVETVTVVEPSFESETSPSEKETSWTESEMIQSEEDLSSSSESTDIYTESEVGTESEANLEEIDTGVEDFTVELENDEALEIN